MHGSNVKTCGQQRFQRSRREHGDICVQAGLNEARNATCGFSVNLRAIALLTAQASSMPEANHSGSDVNSSRIVPEAREAH